MTLMNRQSPPEPLDPISFEIEHPFRSKLASGLEVVIFPNNKLPLVSFRLAFQSGDIHDPADAQGLTSATTSMLTEGTSEYTSAQLAEKIERLGAGLSAHASDDFTTIAASCLSLYSQEILHLVADVVLRPTFPENELDLYRRNTIEHLKFQRSQPAFLANEQSARLIYGEHPYANISPRAEDIQKLGRENLTTFHHQRFIASNAMLIAVGDVEPDALMKDLDDLLGDWKQGSAPENVTASTSERKVRTITIVDRPASAQSNIVIGNLAIKRTDPDYFPMLVMNQVLGAGASSRVFMNLREEKGYTYGAYTRLETKKLAGDFEATAEVRTAVTGESLREFFLEFDRIRQESVGEVELDDAKNFLTGVFPLRAETQEGLTNLIVNQHLYSLPDDYLQTYRDNVRGVSADEVRRVAQEYIRTEEMAIVIVGDAEEVLPQVQTYAESIEVFDTEGNRK